jgi:putative ABC transport system substrate-binding protein
MGRREFITLFGGATLARPLAARAQQSSAPVVGFLHSSSPGAFSQQIAAFRQSLNESGFVEGRSVAIEFRWAEDRYERLPALAAELVGQRRGGDPRGGGNISAAAAKAATSTIPIVFPAVAPSGAVSLPANVAVSRPPNGRCRGARCVRLTPSSNRGCRISSFR